MEEAHALEGNLMKAEMTENSVKLLPENKWEEDVLKVLRKKGVERVRFENDWDAKGKLELVHITHPWDK